MPNHNGSLSNLPLKLWMGNFLVVLYNNVFTYYYPMLHAGLTNGGWWLN